MACNNVNLSTKYKTEKESTDEVEKAEKLFGIKLKKEKEKEEDDED